MDLTSSPLPYESLSYSVMADSLHYPPATHYVPPSYFSQSHASGHLQVTVPTPRQDTTTQRKRPKYTRSKTGCLTCRAKKIKCDESKPNCLRCTHGQRECTWPEGVPARKKPTPRKEHTVDGGYDTRPSTAGSSGVSDASTPPTRDITPPKREPVDAGLPPLVSRRHSEPVIQVPMAGDLAAVRRQSVAAAGQGYPMHPNSHSSHASHTQMLPVIPEMSSPYSAHQHYHNSSYSSASHQYPQAASLALPRITSQHDHLRSVDAHLMSGHWSSPSLLTPVDPLEPFFPSVQERNLIRHYCDNALSIIMAYPSENPVLAANLQFILHRNRGSEMAVESLRMALLGIAAVHQSFLLSRQGVCNGEGGADDCMQLAYSFRTKAKHSLYAACNTVDGARDDATLAAATGIILIDIFSGGQGWGKTLTLAKTLVNMRGGPAVLLARSLQSKHNTVTGVSRARLLLETVAVYELFGCLSTGQEPTLLSPHTSSWWLDHANAEDVTSHVEKVFGMSRQLVPLLARITSFVSQALRNRSKVREYSPDESAVESEDVERARMLYSLLENWTRAPTDVVPSRVRMGDNIYTNLAQVILLRDVLGLAPDDPLVQQHANTILNGCADCGQSTMGVDLNWPLIIAGCQMFGADRPRVLNIFDQFRLQCCYEVETSEHIVLQVWKRLDEELPGADWRSVMHDLKLDVLIL